MMLKTKHFLGITVASAMIACNDSEPNTIETELTEVELVETESDTTVVTNIESPVVTITDNDLRFCDSLIQELTGIERYIVMQDYTMLSAILEFKGEAHNAKAVNEIIIAREGEFYPIKVTKLDSKNGYIEYAPMYAEVSFSATYWKLKDGGRLIGIESNSCGPVCESELSFMKFMDGMYNDVELKDVIPEIDILKETLYPNYKNIEHEDALEFKYILPQGGKNITYALNDKELVLEWVNEKFELI